MGAGQPQLLSHFDRFTSHTSPKKHCAYLPAPTALPPTDELCTDVIFLRVGRILPKKKKILGHHLHLLLSICITTSLRALDLGGTLQSHLCFLLSGVTSFPQMPQILCATHFWKDVCKLQPNFLCVLFLVPLSSPFIHSVSYHSLSLSCLSSFHTRQHDKYRAASFVVRLLAKPHCIGCVTCRQFCCTICSHEPLIKPQTCTHTETEPIKRRRQIH